MIAIPDVLRSADHLVGLLLRLELSYLSLGTHKSPFRRVNNDLPTTSVSILTTRCFSTEFCRLYTLLQEAGHNCIRTRRQRDSFIPPS